MWARALVRLGCAGSPVPLRALCRLEPCAAGSPACRALPCICSQRQKGLGKRCLLGLHTPPSCCCPPHAPLPAGLTTFIATQPAFHRSFCLRENMADISAKTQAGRQREGQGWDWQPGSRARHRETSICTPPPLFCADHSPCACKPLVYLSMQAQQMVMDNLGLATAVGLNYLCRHTGECARGWVGGWACCSRHPRPACM